MTVAESKEFKVKDDDTKYFLKQCMTGDYFVWWYDEDKVYKEVDYTPEIVKQHFDSGNWKFFGEEKEVVETKPTSALDKQVSGNHYKDCGIQPIEYIHANGLSYLEGNVIKYTTRHSKKNGKADIEKAIHYLELILEMEYKGETE